MDWRLKSAGNFTVSNYGMFAFVNVFFFFNKSVPNSDYTATNGKVMYEYSHFLSYNQLII